MNNFDINELIIYAARYVLGRSTYAVQHVIEIIKRDIDKLNDSTIDCLISDIDYAHHKNDLGMDMDKTEWLALLVLLNKKKNGK